jgi:DNA-binding CsgD family transcriptional regulator
MRGQSGRSCGIDRACSQLTASKTGNGLRPPQACRYLGHIGFNFQAHTQLDQQEIDSLTDRQKDCLRLVGRGFTSKEIGRLLDLSPSTVDNHVNIAVQVLKAPNRGSAARALAQMETGQKLPRQSAEIALSARFPKQTSEREVESTKLPSGLLLSLPPVGGKRNELDGTTRSLRILQVAVVAAVVSIALTIMISGLFRTFG